MTSLSVPQDDQASTRAGTLVPTTGWVRIGLLAVAFVALFRVVFFQAFGIKFEDGFELVGYAWTNGDWSHAFIVPLISLFFIYQHRDQLARIQPKTNWFGLVILIAGIVFYGLGIYPIRNGMVMGYSMILALGGLVLLMTGWQMSRILWFPVAYLVFAVRVSDKIWEALSFKLQWIAAQCATVVISILGIPMGLEAEVTGTQITLVKDFKVIEPPLTVAEACSGIRSLMMFIALGVAVAFLARRPWWARLLLVLLTIPVAIAANVLRVTALGLIYPYNPEWTRGDAHTFIGLIILLIVALAMFIGIGWLLDWIAPERDDQSDQPDDKNSSTPNQPEPAP